MHVRGIEICFFLWFCYWILEKFRQCDIFLLVEKNNGGNVTNQTGILIDIKILIIQDGNLSDLCRTGLNQVRKKQQH